MLKSIARTANARLRFLRRRSDVINSNDSDKSEHITKAAACLFLVSFSFDFDDLGAKDPDSRSDRWVRFGVIEEFVVGRVFA